MRKSRMLGQLLIFIVIAAVSFFLFEAFALPTEVLALILIVALFLYFQSKLDRLRQDLRNVEARLQKIRPEQFSADPRGRREP